MTIEVFWGSGSPFAWRVLLALEIKGIPYVSRLLSFSAGEHKTPEFLAVNPRGKVPAVRDGDFVLPESLAILAYLDRKHPEPPLFGRTPEETGRVWKAVCDELFYLEPAGDRIIQPIFGERIDESSDDMKAAAETIHAEWARMNEVVSAEPWLAGAQISAADVVAYPDLAFLLRIGSRPDVTPLGLGFDGFAERYPALQGWRARIEALPGYDRTYPPHWREAA